MRTLLHKNAVLLLLTCFFLSSCEKEQMLKSSSKVESQLQSTWKKIDMTTSHSHIFWKFNEGKVSLMNYETVLATGNYIVDASLTRVHINTSGFPEPGYDYMNGSWKVIALDDDILVIAGDYSGGVLESEFTKEK